MPEDRDEASALAGTADGGPATPGRPAGRRAATMFDENSAMDVLANDSVERPLRRSDVLLPAWPAGSGGSQSGYGRAARCTRRELLAVGVGWLRAAASSLPWPGLPYAGGMPE